MFLISTANRKGSSGAALDQEANIHNSGDNLQTLSDGVRSTEIRLYLKSR